MKIKKTRVFLTWCLGFTFFFGLSIDLSGEKEVFGILDLNSLVAQDLRDPIQGQSIGPPKIRVLTPYDPPMLEEPSPCYQKMQRCEGQMTAYNCVRSFTSDFCRAYYCNDCN
ncbi:hypothetical protein [Algoriphagus namhaensis]